MKELHTMTHSKFAPSSATRWLSCPQSLIDVKPVENSDSEASVVGTLLHECCENLLLKNRKPPSLKKFNKRLLKTFPTGRGLNSDIYSEHIKGVYMYVDYIKSLKLKGNVEERIAIYGDDVYGTVDYKGVGGKTLHIVDYKSGRMRVNAYENPQLMLYAYGALTPSIRKVKLHIVQPKYGISVYKIKAKALKAWFKERVKPVIKSVRRGVGSYTTSINNCKYCDKYNDCSAVAELTNGKYGISSNLQTNIDNLVSLEVAISILYTRGVPKHFITIREQLSDAIVATLHNKSYFEADISKIKIVKLSTHLVVRLKNARGLDISDEYLL